MAQNRILSAEEAELQALIKKEEEIRKEQTEFYLGCITDLQACINGQVYIDLHPEVVFDRREGYNVVLKESAEENTLKTELMDCRSRITASSSMQRKNAIFFGEVVPKMQELAAQYEKAIAVNEEKLGKLEAQLKKADAQEKIRIKSEVESIHLTIGHPAGEQGVSTYRFAMRTIHNEIERAMKEFYSPEKSQGLRDYSQKTTEKKDAEYLSLLYARAAVSLQKGTKRQEITTAAEEKRKSVIGLRDKVTEKSKILNAVSKGKAHAGTLAEDLSDITGEYCLQKFASAQKELTAAVIASTKMNEKISVINPAALEALQVLKKYREKKEKQHYLFPGKKERVCLMLLELERDFVKSVTDTGDVLASFDRMIEAINKRRHFSSLGRKHPVAFQLMEIREKYLQRSLPNQQAQEALADLDKTFLQLMNPEAALDEIERSVNVEFEVQKKELEKTLVDIGKQIDQVRLDEEAEKKALAAFERKKSRDREPAEEVKSGQEEKQKILERARVADRARLLALENVMASSRDEARKLKNITKEEFHTLLKSINDRMLGKSVDREILPDAVRDIGGKGKKAVQRAFEKGKTLFSVKKMDSSFPEETLAISPKSEKINLKFSGIYQDRAASACHAVYGHLSQLWLSDAVHPLVQEQIRLRAASASAIYHYIAGVTSRMVLDEKGNVRNKEEHNVEALNSLETAWLLFSNMISTNLPMSAVIEVGTNTNDPVLKGILDMIIEKGSVKHEKDWLNTSADYVTNGSMLNVEAAAELAQFVSSPEGCCLSSDINEGGCGPSFLMKSAVDKIKSNIVRYDPNIATGSDILSEISLASPEEIRRRYNEERAYEELVGLYNTKMASVAHAHKGVMNSFDPPDSEDPVVKGRMMVAAVFFNYALSTYQKLIDHPLVKGWDKAVEQRDYFSLELVNVALLIAQEMMTTSMTLEQSMVKQKRRMNEIMKNFNYHDIYNLNAVFKSMVDEFSNIEKSLSSYREYATLSPQSPIEICPAWSAGIASQLTGLHLAPENAKKNFADLHEKAGVFDERCFLKSPKEALQAHQATDTYMHAAFESLSAAGEKAPVKTGQEKSLPVFSKEQFEEDVMNESWNIAVKSMEVKHKMQIIEDDPALKEYFNGFVRAVTQVVLACQTLDTGMIERQKDSREEKAAEMIGNLATLVPVPVAQSILSGLQAALNKAGEHRREQEIEAIASFWSDPVTMAQFVRELAMHLVLDRQEFITSLACSSQQEKGKLLMAAIIHPADSEVTQLAKKEAAQFLDAIIKDKLNPNPNINNPEAIESAARATRGLMLTAMSVRPAYSETVIMEAPRPGR